MEMFLVTFQAVAALLGIGVIGYWLIGRHRVSGDTLGFLATLSIDVAVPCLVLSSLIIDFFPEKEPNWWHMPLWWLGFVGVTLLLSLLCSMAAGRKHRREFAMGLFYQNGLFFPLIILTGLFGANTHYLVLLFLFVFLHPTLIFSTYSLFFSKKDSPRGLNLARILNPVLVSTIVGMSIALIGLADHVPQFVKTLLLMVGAMASPLFMLILGGNLYHDLRTEAGGGRTFHLLEVVKFSVAKTIVFPLLVLGILALIKPDFPVALIIMIEAAVPPITAIPIFAERSGGDRSICSQFIVGSFLLSMITIPLTLSLFSFFFPFPV